MDLFVRESLLKTIDEINFRPDRPLRTARRVLDCLDDVRRRAIEITLLDDLTHALRMNQNLHARDLVAHFVDMPRFEPAMDRTVAAPKYELRFEQLLGCISTQLFVRIPERHLVERDSELRPGVPSEMLVGKEEHLVELFQVNVEQR